MTASTWLKDFTELAQGGDGPAIANAFVLDGFWRDYLPFGGTLQTLEGRDAIARFGAAKGPSTGLSAIEFEGDDKASEGFFRFQTHEGAGRGYRHLGRRSGFPIWSDSSCMYCMILQDFVRRSSPTQRAGLLSYFERDVQTRG